MGTVKGGSRGSDERLSLNSLRLMRAESPLDHSKAVRELGWNPRPVEESIREAARFWVQLRAAKRAAEQEMTAKINSAGNHDRRGISLVFAVTATSHRSSR